MSSCDYVHIVIITIIIKAELLVTFVCVCGKYIALSILILYPEDVANYLDFLAIR